MDYAGLVRRSQNLRLLMVEDDAATVEAVKLGLEIYLPALTFKAAGNGKEALQMLNQGGFDSVLVDLGLPDIDGIDLIKQVRTFSQIPIVVLSARSSQEVIYQALKSGANEYVTKPFRYCDLLKTLINQMSKVNP
jgi:two-component system KDP operon response regulator KdpE